MWFRRPAREFGKSDANREGLREIVAAGREPGLLAYDGGDRPVGWVSVAPREEFLPRLRRSPAYHPFPGEGVWSVLCFVVKVGHRRQGIASALLDAAVRYARDHGAAAVEGHPVDTGGGRAVAAFDLGPGDRPAGGAGVRSAGRGAAVPAGGHRGRRPPRHGAAGRAGGREHGAATGYSLFIFLAYG